MAIRFNSLTGEYEDDNGDGEVTALGGPNAPIVQDPTGGNQGYDPAQPAAPASGGNTSSAASSTPDYSSQITQQYQTSLGRAPTAAELASDVANAQKYGTSGSLLSDIAARAGNTPGTGDRQATSASTSAPTGTSGSGSTSSFSSQWAPPNLTGSQWGPSTAPTGPTQDQIDTKARTDALYQRLLADSNQSLNIDRNDPIIRAQADAYSANEERARRNYLSDTAESNGPYANLEGARRMSAERMGQRTGSYEAGLLGSELTARRAAIQDRLHSMQGMLSAEQVQELQQELALMDNAIREKQIAAGVRGQDLNQDQFLRQLALNENDRTNYWDYARTYGL